MIARKQAKSEGADGFPVAWQWLADLGVKPGEFQVETKARLALAMRSREWPEKQRVWACLSLATMGFNQELAVRMERGRVVPLTQSDIAAQTGIDVHNVHRCVLDLESEGWLKRTAVDEARGLRKGEVQILCYAIPRPPKKSRAVAEEAAAAGSEYDGLPDEVSYWLRHLKFHAPGSEKLEEACALCLELTERRERLRDLCRREPDQMPLPGISANSAKVARLAKSKGGEVPRAIDSGSARTGQNEAVGLRAGRNGVGARPNSARINRNEIKEIKKLTAAAVSEGREGGEWTRAAAAVQRFFPRTEDAFVAELARCCRAVLLDAGKDPGLLTDQTLADAVAMAHKPGQHSAGLFKRTVPAVLVNWAKPKAEPARIVEYVDFVEET